MEGCGACLFAVSLGPQGWGQALPPPTPGEGRDGSSRLLGVSDPCGRQLGCPPPWQPSEWAHPSCLPSLHLIQEWMLEGGGQPNKKKTQNCAEHGALKGGWGETAQNPGFAPPPDQLRPWLRPWVIAWVCHPLLEHSTPDEKPPQHPKIQLHFPVDFGSSLSLVVKSPPAP